jgi:hypothetical protein
VQKVPQRTVLAQDSRTLPDADQGSPRCRSSYGDNARPDVLEHETPQTERVLSGLEPDLLFNLPINTRNPDMPKRSSTARGREFGEGVRAAITNAGLTAREAADLLSWQEAKVSDVVTGKGGVSRLEVALLLGVCRTKADERDHLLELFPDRDVSGWWQLHGKCAPIRPRTALTHLAAAETLISWHTHAVPVLLRTTDYMRAVLAASATVPVEELDERLRVQQEMQKLLSNGLDCIFYIHELALDLQVGGPEEHISQLQHLMLETNVKKIRILIVPAAAGAHAGIAGPFTQLTFPKYESLVELLSRSVDQDL